MRISLSLTWFLFIRAWQMSAVGDDDDAFMRTSIASDDKEIDVDRELDLDGEEDDGGDAKSEDGDKDQLDSEKEDEEEEEGREEEEEPDDAKEIADLISGIAGKNVVVQSHELNAKRAELLNRKHTWHERFIDFLQDEKIKLSSRCTELADLFQNSGYAAVYNSEQLDRLYLHPCPALSDANTKTLLRRVFLSEWQLYREAVRTPSVIASLNQTGLTFDQALASVTVRSARGHPLMRLSHAVNHSHLNLGILNLSPLKERAHVETTARAEALLTSSTRAKSVTSVYAAAVHDFFRCGVMYQLREKASFSKSKKEVGHKQEPLASKPMEWKATLPDLKTDVCWTVPESAAQTLQRIQRLVALTDAGKRKDEMVALHTVIERESRCAQLAYQTAFSFFLEKFKQTQNKIAEYVRASQLPVKYNDDVRRVLHLLPLADMRPVPVALRRQLEELSLWMQDRMQEQGAPLADEKRPPPEPAALDPIFFRNLCVNKIRMIQWNFVTQCYNEAMQNHKTISEYNRQAAFNMAQVWLARDIIEVLETIKEDAKKSVKSLDPEWDTRVQKMCDDWDRFMLVELPAVFEASKARCKAARSSLLSEPNEKAPDSVVAALQKFVMSNAKSLVMEGKQEDKRLSAMDTESINQKIQVVMKWHGAIPSREVYRYWIEIHAALRFVLRKNKMETILGTSF